MIRTIRSQAQVAPLMRIRIYADQLGHGDILVAITGTAAILSSPSRSFVVDDAAVAADGMIEIYRAGRDDPSLVLHPGTVVTIARRTR